MKKFLYLRRCARVVVSRRTMAQCILHVGVRIILREAKLSVVQFPAFLFIVLRPEEMRKSTMSTRVRIAVFHKRENFLICGNFRSVQRNRVQRQVNDQLTNATYFMKLSCCHIFAICREKFHENWFYHPGNP